mmetsp:Transcript_16850/g.26294  ORF Transcript_16850/g.26294 Transcript_16850/m.26294 type:complete len:435 (-) Transcript_16850:188-1492(-)|eukprot:CAMPEP_0196820132 /NCGR_PEP_ID=MMETSP1362-20130617/73764_1 /TAXON_ID=163516 /ORGANISM="Leptocylindrus danicus, Strain CCMP1856" /LENGTH=434 /DNA_ID=CAMNT_0042198889 /DNA_START=21 /DNA_END=1325 /DNA_ORIENTATION=-
MAGKTRGSAKQRKRADAAAREITEQQIVAAEKEKLQSKGNDDLFILDTSGNNSGVAIVNKTKSSRYQINTEEKKKQSGKHLGAEEARVKKLLKAHDAATLQAMAAKPKVVTKTSSKSKASFDLWGDNDDNVAVKDKESCRKQVRGGQLLVPVTAHTMAAAGTAPVELVTPAEAARRAQRKSKPHSHKQQQPKVAVDLPHGGQSYQPDKEQHQDVIGEALAVELRRKDAVEYRRTPLWNGMSKETLALLDTRSDSDSDGDDDVSDDEGGIAAAGNFQPKKKKEKLTRAQRNRQKRARQQDVENQKQKRLKKFNQSVMEVKTIFKTLRREEADKKERKQQLNELLEKKKAEPLGVNLVEKLSSKIDPINAPALPVALSSEIAQGSLRSIKPKGSLMSERLESMAARKMAHKRRIGEKRKVTQGKIRPGKGREYMLV